MRVAQRAAGRPSRYDGHCLSLGAEEVARREAAGEPFVVRMRVPDTGVCVVNDLRRGPIEFDYSTVDMQVLIKSDGLPTYHLANVVDDHLMEISHVFRGEEWVSSAPKHLLLYEYFGWQPPILMHLPLLRNPDKSKLSKRKNPTGILFFEAMGYLPEALVNFLALMANAVREGEDELMDLPAIVRRFEAEHVPIGGPVFDLAKLDWLNGRYLRERLDPATLLARVQALGGAAGAAGARRGTRSAAHRAFERSRPALGVPVLRKISAERRFVRRREARRTLDPPCLRARAARVRQAPGVERAGDRDGDVAPRASARTKGARRRPPVLHRDHRQSDVDPPLRFDGAARSRHGARAPPKRAGPARRAEQTRAEEWEQLLSRVEVVA